MTYRVLLLPRANQDIAHISDWLAERSSAGAARWMEALEKAIDDLESRAESFGFAPENEFVDHEIRQLFFKTPRGKSYRMLFTVVGSDVRVLHVRGPGQDFVTAEEL